MPLPSTCEHSLQLGRARMWVDLLDRRLLAEKHRAYASAPSGTLQYVRQLGTRSLEPGGKGSGPQLPNRNPVPPVGPVLPLFYPCSRFPSG